jgi:hypothetical protein
LREKKRGLKTKTGRTRFHGAWREPNWNFNTLPILHPDHHRITDLSATDTAIRNYWQKIVFEMQRLEEENNRIFIKAYGLENELTPEAPLHKTTLTCNPHYRYGQGKTDEAYEALQKADTMKELISYSVGCMMGRYSLDEPVLIYAHSANVGFDPSRYKTFPADDEGVIPIMDVDWFPDDMAERFKKFLKVTFGEKHYGENLQDIGISTSASQGDKTKALKEVDKIKKVLDEVDEYERDTVYPLATKQIEIDLDDGVKENYPKFGKALKKIAGLS